MEFFIRICVCFTLNICYQCLSIPLDACQNLEIVCYISIFWPTDIDMKNLKWTFLSTHRIDTYLHLLEAMKDVAHHFYPCMSEGLLFIILDNMELTP